METLSVVCPECRSRLSIQVVPGIQDKMLQCPICKYKAKVSLFQIGQTGKGGLGASDEDTELPWPHKINKDVGQLHVIQTDQICELREGSQVVGRLSTTGKADLQIGGDNYSDKFMSRNHVQIDVVKTAHGLEHRLVEIGAKNIPQLNGKDIKHGDIIVLHFGDKLTLGKTEIVLEETDEEATEIV